MPVQRVGGRVEVEDDLLRRAEVRVEEQVDEQRLDVGRLGRELGVAGGLGLLNSSRFRVDLPASGAQSARRAASLSASVASRVVAELVVVVGVLVAERDADHALQHEGFDVVFDQRRVARRRSRPPGAGSGRCCAASPSNRSDRTPYSDRRSVSTVARSLPFSSRNSTTISISISGSRGNPATSDAMREEYPTATA